jgi:protoporphyrinogen oxidase
MDGRIQESTIRYLKENYEVDYVDVITEPGPCKILAEQSEKILVDSILKRIDISLIKHNSELIIVSGHHDCAGNPVDKDKHIDQVKESIKYLKNRYPGLKIIGIWIDDRWKVYGI